MALIVFPLQAVAPDPDIEYTARDFRAFVDTLITEGVADVAGGDLLVSQRAAGANLTVDVAVGTAFVDGDDSAAQGSYHVESDAVVNVGPFGAAPGSGARIDLVVLRVYDEQAGAPAGTSGPVIVAGVAAGSPVAPALPDSAVPLAEVRLNAGDTSVQTANITDRRVQATGLQSADALLDRVAATTTVVNTGAETTLYSRTIEGGVLPVGGVLRLALRGDWFNNSGASRTLNVAVKFGGNVVTVFNTTAIPVSAIRRSWALDLTLVAESDAAQRVYSRLEVTGTTSGTPAGTLLDASAVDPGSYLAAAYRAAAEDTTADKDLTVSVQHPIAHASLDMRLHTAILELL